MPAKVISLFIDGTWDQPTWTVDTNVRKLFLACKHDPNDRVAPQVTYYLPGVGTNIKQSHPGSRYGVYKSDPTLQRFGKGKVEVPWHLRPFRKWGPGATGSGTAERIKEAYAFLCREYDRTRGDRVFVFGFSRGAYAVRSLVNFISKVGVLLADKLNYVPEAYRLYETGGDAASSRFFRYLTKLTGRVLQYGDDRAALPIHFMGVWDTVGAMGLPGRRAQYQARHSEFKATDVPPNVMAVRHALALHELRETFEPMLWTNSKGHPSLLQVWFPGAHGDVGGGFLVKESGLSDIALRWMTKEALAHGLLLKPTSMLLAGPTNAEVLHCELREWFRYATPTPRRQLNELLLHAGADEWLHAMHFHTSLTRHLLKSSPGRYAFRAKTNEALFGIDDLAFTLATLAALKGNNPVTNRP